MLLQADFHRVALINYLAGLKEFQKHRRMGHAFYQEQLRVVEWSKGARRGLPSTAGTTMDDNNGDAVLSRCKVLMFRRECGAWVGLF